MTFSRWLRKEVYSNVLGNIEALCETGLVALIAIVVGAD